MLHLHTILYNEWQVGIYILYFNQKTSESRKIACQDQREFFSVVLLSIFCSSGAVGYMKNYRVVVLVLQNCKFFMLFRYRLQVPTKVFL